MRSFLVGLFSPIVWQLILSHYFPKNRAIYWILVLIYGITTTLLIVSLLPNDNSV